MIANGGVLDLAVLELTELCRLLDFRANLCPRSVHMSRAFFRAMTVLRQSRYSILSESSWINGRDFYERRNSRKPYGFGLS